jgi:hypothetical protein
MKNCELDVKSIIATLCNNCTGGVHYVICDEMCTSEDMRIHQENAISLNSSAIIFQGILEKTNLSCYLPAFQVDYKADIEKYDYETVFIDEYKINYSNNDIIFMCMLFSCFILFGFLLFAFKDRYSYETNEIPSNEIKLIIDDTDTVSYSSEVMNETCSICLDDYELKEKLMLLNCNHAFHERCISKWFKENAKCPLCNKSYCFENSA